MDKDAGYMTFRIRRRPWYVWLSRAVWIFWLAFWTEFAVGSWLEREQQAYSIAVKVLLVSVTDEEALLTSTLLNSAEVCGQSSMMIVSFESLKVTEVAVRPRDISPFHRKVPLCSWKSPRRW